MEWGERKIALGHPPGVGRRRRLNEEAQEFGDLAGCRGIAEMFGRWLSGGLDATLPIPVRLPDSPLATRAGLARPRPGS